MTSHFVRTFIALACLAFLGVMSMYAVDNCDLARLTCNFKQNQAFQIESIVTKILDRVQ